MPGPQIERQRVSEPGARKAILQLVLVGNDTEIKLTFPTEGERDAAKDIIMNIKLGNASMIASDVVALNRAEPAVSAVAAEPLPASNVPSRPSEAEALKYKILESNPLLLNQYRSLVKGSKTISEESFWDTAAKDHMDTLVSYPPSYYLLYSSTCPVNNSVS